MDSRTRNSTRNILASAINRVVLMILPFIARTVLVNTLGSEYLGLNGLFTSILNVLNLSELGFGAALVYSMYKPIADKDTDKVCALLFLYKKIYTIIGIVIGGIGLLCMPFLQYLIKGGSPADVNLHILYLIYLINVVISYEFYAYKIALFTAHQRSDVQSNVSTIFNIFVYVAQIVLLIVFKNYYIYIAWLPILTLLENFYMAKLATKYYPNIVCKGNITQEEKKNIRDHVKGLALQKFCGASRNSFDSIIVSIYLGLAVIAIYSNYYYIMYSIHIFLYQIPNSIRASVGNSIATETQMKNYCDFNKMNLIYMTVSGICCTCMLCLYQPFMEIWMGTDMIFPTSTMILFCIYFIELSLSDIISLYKDGAGLWWKGRYRTLFEALLNLVLNFLFGWLWGVNGILLATILSMAIMGLGYAGWIIFRYYFTEYTFYHYIINQLVIIGVIAAAGGISFYLCELISFDGIFSLVLRAIISVFVTISLFFVIYHKTSYYREAISLLCNIKNIFRK